jgi:serine/threonine protein kinase
MEGGAIIGQGHYGCVFDPPLLCETAIEKKKGRQQRVVGKLSDESDVKDELMAATILSEIHNADQYFVLPDTKSYCDDIVPLEKQPDKAIKACDAIEYFGTANMVHYTMPFGGISIMRYFESQTMPFNVRDMVNHMLEGAALMTLNGYVHYDIHMGNILIDSKDSKPRFIDFGFSFSSYNITDDVLDERWKVYKPSYPAEPPEVTVITGLKDKYKFDTVVKQVIKEKPSLKSAETMLGLSRYTQLNDFVKFWNTSGVCKKKDWVGFFRLYWPAFDAWGLGFIIIYLYSKSVAIKNVSPDWPALSSQLKELLRGLLRMDPRKRLDCVEALNLFNPSSHVLSSGPGKAWLEQREAVRAQL